MVRSTKFRTLLPVLIPAFALIVYTDSQLRKMERFEELVAKGQGINSPLADFLHRRFGSTLAIKQVREDLEFEIEPVRRLKLWLDLMEAYDSQGDSKGMIDACASWIKEYPNDPRTLRAYEKVIQQLEKQNDTKGIQKYLQGWKDALIAMGPEAKLSELLKWWEFAVAHPRLADETPIFERVYHDYPKHVPSLGALKSLEMVYAKQGKLQEVAGIRDQIKLLEKRASPLQRNQSEQQVAEFLLNQRMWDQLQERMVQISGEFFNSINFEGLQKKIFQQSRDVLGADGQLEFYRKAVEQALRRVPADRQPGNVPLSTLVGDYGMLLWNKGRADEAWKIARILQTVGPRSPAALQLERLVWLRNPETPIRLPHATVERVSAPPQLDGLQSDLCWFGEEHRMGEMGAVAGAEPHPTQIWATYDEKFLYLFFRCQEPNIDRLTKQQSQGSAWLNDCVEVFFNPEKKYTAYFQLVASAQGTTSSYRFIIREQNIKSASLEPQPWDSKAEAVVGFSSDAWTCEMRVPWEQLEFKPKPGETLFFNARRFRYLGGQQTIYSWAPVLTSGHEPESFGILKLK